MMERVTGAPPVLWGTSIIGFGSTFSMTQSKPLRDWPLVAFSARKAHLVLYLMAGCDALTEITARLGVFSTGASCLYIKALDDIDMAVLEELVRASLATPGIADA